MMDEMDEKKNTGFQVMLVSLLVVVFGLVFLVNAADPGDADVVSGTPETWNSSSPGTMRAEGGNITELNLSGTSQTVHWQGFWGEVDGTIALRDPSNNTLFNWTYYTTSLAGNVYASNESTIAWRTLAAAGKGDCDCIMGGASDNCTNTFTGGPRNFTVAGSSVDSVWIVQTFNFSGSGTFDEGLMTDTNSKLVYAATIYHDVNTFKNGTADYQMIVPVNGTDVRTYYFWIELA